MIIRIISEYVNKDTRILPGEIVDFNDAEAEALIEEGMAVPFDLEEEVKPKKTGKAVKHGAG